MVRLLWGNSSYYYFTYLATLVNVQFWLIADSYYLFFFFNAWPYPSLLASRIGLKSNIPLFIESYVTIFQVLETYEQVKAGGQTTRLGRVRKWIVYVNLYTEIHWYTINLYMVYMGENGLEKPKCYNSTRGLKWTDFKEKFGPKQGRTIAYFFAKFIKTTIF